MEGIKRIVLMNITKAIGPLYLVWVPLMMSTIKIADSDSKQLMVSTVIMTLLQTRIMRKLSEPMTMMVMMIGLVQIIMFGCKWCHPFTAMRNRTARKMLDV